MSVLTNPATGRHIDVRGGLQPFQYRDQLHQAGMLSPVLRATGRDRASLVKHLNLLVRHLRHGVLYDNTREAATALGLIITPTGVYPERRTP